MKRSKRRSYRGSSGAGLSGMGIWAGPLTQIMGAVVVVICMIVFGLTVQQLDTQITSAASYSWATGLTSIMGVFGMVLWVVFIVAGLAAVGAGAAMNIKKGLGMGLSGVAMLVVFGGVSVLIMMIVNGIALTQLNTAIGVVNSTTNYATYFTSTVSIMGIFGVVIFVTFVGSAISQFGFAFYSGFKSIKSLF